MRQQKEPPLLIRKASFQYLEMSWLHHKDDVVTIDEGACEQDRSARLQIHAESCRRLDRRRRRTRAWRGVDPGRRAPERQSTCLPQSVLGQFCGEGAPTDVAVAHEQKRAHLRRPWWVSQTCPSNGPHRVAGGLFEPTSQTLDRRTVGCTIRQDWCDGSWSLDTTTRAQSICHTAVSSLLKSF